MKPAFFGITLPVLSALLLIAASLAEAQTEKVLFNFTYGDGQYPASRLSADGAGNFYGTTLYGGIEGNVFELSPNGSGGWNETVLYSFCFDGYPSCADGAQPFLSYLVIDPAGNLYGTTEYGGANGYGVVFELSPDGAGWKETVLHSFGVPSGTDGSAPINGLIMDSAGNLYGTTFSGGGCGCGSVFELSPSGDGWTERVIYATDIGMGYAGLAMDAAGNIFGANASTVFQLSPNGNGGWNPTVIHTFTGGPKDGSDPQGTPVLDQAGNLYGTTAYGGAKNLGTVYKLIPGKRGKWTEKILHSFKGGPKDGGGPVSGIALDIAGNLYGTTQSGGKCSNPAEGYGTVFELAAPVGKGSYKEKILWNFNGTDGLGPTDSLVLDSAGNLYGTTVYGGTLNVGVVFEVTP
jgi:uncharacterized repeat protein (TIGR03803 family)